MDLKLYRLSLIRTVDFSYFCYFIKQKKNKKNNLLNILKKWGKNTFYSVIRILVKLSHLKKIKQKRKCGAQKHKAEQLAQSWRNVLIKMKRIWLMC